MNTCDMIDCGTVDSLQIEKRMCATRRDISRQTTSITLAPTSDVERGVYVIVWSVRYTVLLLVLAHVLAELTSKVKTHVTAHRDGPPPDLPG